MELLAKARDRNDFCLREQLGLAQGLAIFPRLKNRAFFFSGRKGDGLFVRRLAGSTPAEPGDRWSAHTFVRIGGGGVGFQAGWQTLGALAVFETADAANKLAADQVKLTFGGGASATAGRRGVNTSKFAAIGPGVTLYVIGNEGLFGGAKLETLWIRIDEERTDGYYSTPGARPLESRTGTGDGPARRLFEEFASTEQQGNGRGAPAGCNVQESSESW